MKLNEVDPFKPWVKTTIFGSKKNCVGDGMCRWEEAEDDAGSYHSWRASE